VVAAITGAGVGGSPPPAATGLVVAVPGLKPPGFTGPGLGGLTWGRGGGTRQRAKIGLHLPLMQ